MHSPLGKLAVTLAAIACLPGLTRADDLADARDALEKLGLRAISTAVLLPAESDLAKELSKSALLRKNLTLAAKDQQNVENQAILLQKTLTGLRQQHVVLNAQLANVNPNDVTTNNRLVGALNAIAGQFDLLKEKQGEMEEAQTAARAKVNEAREAYVQMVLSSRKLADQIAADYELKAVDPAVKAAIDKLNAATGKPVALGPSTAFAGNVRRLKALEDTVLSESIPLRDSGGGTFHVSVVVNGKEQQEMVLDSGASLISLPLALAERFGLKPSDKDPTIVLQLADGREIEGRLMKLKSVRVGKFSVEDVECAVLGEDAIRAEPLLGMSFLGNFKFEVDATAKELTMVKVAGADGK
ncbi:MAG TPA: retropepsin-like aspartic protease [Pirellulaceae bacterium]|nr:retropepsin-like aspartic protease [Pirellulaceae bacterium]